MKKLVTTLILATILGMAQSRKMEYLQGQLSIEIEKSIIASYSDWDAFLSRSIRIGGAGLVIKESKKWDCYKGGIKISEGEFYKTAGLNEYAEKAQSHKNQRDLFGWGGFTLAMVGCGITGYELLRWQMSEDPSSELNQGLCYLGLGIASVGLTFEIIGFTQPPKLTTVGFAIGVADEYNRNLRKSLDE